MRYGELVELYGKIESTSKRLEKTEYISEFLKDVESKDLPDVMLLIEGKVYPDWDPRKIGVAAQLMIKAIAHASGLSPSRVEESWKKTGDLGDTAEKVISAKKQHTLGSVEITSSKVMEA